MISGHAVLDVRWHPVRGTTAAGDRAHVLGLSVPDERGGETAPVARWSLDGDVLRIESDAFGYQPLFHWTGEVDGEHRIIVGTSPIAVVAAGAPGEPDREELGLWCRVGLCLGERTLFKHVRLVPRGSVLSWSKGRLEQTGAGMPVVPASIRSVEEWVQGYCDLFRQAMRRRAPIGERFAMPLSGGRDSRMMLLDALELGHRPAACVTLSGGPRSNHPDAVIARMLAGRHGLPLHEVAARSPWIESETRKHVLGGLLVLEHTWMMPLWDTLRASFGCWYDGLGCGAITRGDLCKASCLAKYKAGAWSDLTREFASYALGVSDARLTELAGIAPWIEPSFESATALVAEEFRRFEGAANPLTAMSFTNWGGRAISLNPYMLCATVRAIHTPFMDRDLVAFLLGYPIERALENDLQTDAVRRMHPKEADVPFDKDLPKPKKTRKPIVKAISGRLTTMRERWSRGGSFRTIGALAAARGDARLVQVVTALALLEQASTQSGAKALLDEFGFDSRPDRASLERHRI
jgi:hypothetical protein